LQPLARIDDPSYERAWAADWIVGDPAREGVTITPEVKEHLWTALTSLASRRSGAHPHRPVVLLQSKRPEAGAAQPYCVGGPMAGCSTPRPSISAKRRGAGVRDRGSDRHRRGAAVLAYLFHRIERRLDGRPTLLIIDEGWLALDDEGFAGQLREWLKTLRKKNASVIFATQSLSDIDGSNRARHHRELPDAALPAERARDRAADHRHLSPLRPQRPPDRDPRAGDAQARLLLPVAARQPAVRTGPRAESRWRSAPHRRRPTRRPSLGEAQSLAYSVDDIEQQFSSTFEDFTADKTGAQLVEGARERWQESLSAFEHSLKAGAVAVDNIDGIERQTSSLVGASKSAVGILQATQAGNELLAVQAQQLADLTAMLAAQGRADALEQARHAAAQEQAREQFGRFMTGRSYSASSVRMFHD
jgi:hypothetical protein